MKNNKPSRVAGVFRSIFNVRKWSDYDRMKDATLYLGNGIRRMFVPSRVDVSDKQKSFADVAQQLNISEATLRAKQRSLWRLSVLMLTISICLLGYTIYNLINRYFTAAMLSVVVMGISLVLAFRYNFWHFQIKERRLGCSIKEWYTHCFLGERHEKNRD